MNERIGFGLYQSCGNRGSVGRVCFGGGGVGSVGGEWVVGLDQGLEGWGSKRHSIHAVKLPQRSGKHCANCVDPSRPSNGGSITIFWASRPCGPAGWLAMLLIKAADV